MRIDFDTRSPEDYARFLAVRRCPIYQFKGSAAIVPDEYASLIGIKAKRKTGKKYTPAVDLFDYQADIVRIAVERRKYAIFADCGLGKTLMLLEFARHCAEQTKGKVLIVSPLMVCRQTVDEALRWYGESFPIGRVKAFDLQYWLNSTSSRDSQIGITNYEAIREGLHPGKLAGLILDESSMLKSHYGAWALLQVQSDDDDAYLEIPYNRDKTRLVHCGYDKAELIEAGILEHQDLIAMKKNKQQYLESQIRETEQALKNLRARLANEGGAA